MQFKIGRTPIDTVSQFQPHALLVEIEYYQDALNPAAAYNVRPIATILAGFHSNRS